MKYKVGDVVLLKNTPGSGWSRDMFRYAGNIVTIRYINDAIFYIQDDEDGWCFRTADVESIATEEIIKSTKEARKLKLEKLKKKHANLVFDGDEICKLASNIFGEDRVDVSNIGNDVELKIYYPEILMDNSKNQRHLIKNLYVRFLVTFYEQNFKDDGLKAEIKMEGARTELSLKEYQSGYRHSHLPTRNNGFSKFCLGSSVFNTLLTNLKLELTEEAWLLMLYSLTNYVSWESLEGGPHIHMERISYSEVIPSYLIREELIKLIKDIPAQCWEIMGTKLNVIANHPLTYSYFNENSSIKTLYIDNKETLEHKINEINRSLEPYSIKFKDEKLPIIVKMEDSEINQDFIGREVINEYIKIISTESVKFIKKHQYEQLKDRNKERVFGKITS